MNANERFRRKCMSVDRCFFHFTGQPASSARQDAETDLIWALIYSPLGHQPSSCPPTRSQFGVHFVSSYDAEWFRLFQSVIDVLCRSLRVHPPSDQSPDGPSTGADRLVSTKFNHRFPFDRCHRHRLVRSTVNVDALRRRPSRLLGGR